MRVLVKRIVIFFKIGVIFIIIEVRVERICWEEFDVNFCEKKSLCFTNFIKFNKKIRDKCIIDLIYY